MLEGRKGKMMKHKDMGNQPEIQHLLREKKYTILSWFLYFQLREKPN